jgi:hypothetical protein
LDHGQSAADQILALEERRYEEIKMENADRLKLRVLSADKWAELKSSFVLEFEKLTAHSHRLNFECDESNANALHVDRLYNGHPRRVLDLVFRPEVPDVLVQLTAQGKTRRDVLTFGLAGSNVSISLHGAGVVLPDFMAQIFLRIAR